MLRLLQLELAKIKTYKTFWILTGIYLLFLVGITSSGMEALRWLAVNGANLGEYDVQKIPLYHFPDIWQNLTWVAQKFKLLPGIYIIISVTNEFTYKTIRQHVIDGLSRADFIGAKVLFIFLISLASTLVVLALGLILGNLYTPSSSPELMVTHIEFVPAYWLATFNYLLLALALAFIIKRAGLAIVILLIYPALEWMIKIPLPYNLEYLANYLPYASLSDLIQFPFSKYAMMAIQETVLPHQWGINLAYIPVLIGLSYATIARKNLS